MSAPIPDYASNVPSMRDKPWLTRPGFKYNINEGYNSIALTSLDQMYPKYEDFKGYKLNPNDLLDFSTVDGSDIVWENSTGFLALGIILIILMILGGIAWCVIKLSCSCIRRCKLKCKRHRSDEKSVLVGSNESNKYARIFCLIGLGISILFLSCGLYGCFVANEHVHTAILDFPKDLDNSLHDAHLFLNTTVDQIDAIFVTSYANFTEAMLQSLGITPQNDEHIPGDVEKIITGLNIALVEASKLEHDFEDAKKEFVANTSPILESLFLSPKLSDAIREGIRTTKLDWYDDPDPEEWKSALNIIGDGLRTDALVLKYALATIPIDDIRSDIRTIDEEMQDWVSYIYYIILFACLYLLAIPTVLFFGVILGSFSGNSRKCINRRRGGHFMNCGIFLIFLTAWLLWIVCLAAFIFSGLVTQIICESVRDLENEYPSFPMENPLKRNPQLNIQSKIGPGFGRAGMEEYILPTYGFIARNCKGGTSAYGTFDLEVAYNASQIFLIADKMPPIPEKDKNFAANLLMEELSVKLAEILEQFNHIELEIESKNFTERQRHLAAAIRQRIKSLSQIIQGVNSSVPQFSEKYNLPKSEQTEKLIEYGTPAEQILHYTQFVFDQISYNVGECEPLWIALDTTIELFCYKISAPVAAFWFSLTLILIMYIPVIISAILLEKYFRKYSN